MSTEAEQKILDGVPPSSGRDTPGGIRDPSIVTSVIQHQVKPGAEAQYETWLQEIMPAAQRFPGHLGVDILRPVEGAGAYTIVLRFDTLEHLQGWLTSPIRQRLITQVEPLLVQAEHVNIKTGLEFWFTPPISAQRQAPPFKQFLVSLSVVFPLTVIVPWALQPLFRVAPVLGLPIVSNLVIGAIVVGLMTYVIMPRYTRLIAAWLYR